MAVVGGPMLSQKYVAIEGTDFTWTLDFQSLDNLDHPTSAGFDDPQGCPPTNNRFGGGGLCLLSFPGGGYPHKKNPPQITRLGGGCLLSFFPWKL